MMWIYDRKPLREHRSGPPAGGGTWEKTLAGVGAKIMFACRNTHIRLY